MPAVPLRARSALVAATVGLALLAAGCGSGSSSTKDTSTTTTTAATTSSSTSITVAPATIPDTRCRSENLRGALGQTDSGAGQRYTALVLTNTGSTPCDLRGFPGVSLLGPSGAQVGEPAGREGAEGAKVTLAPGGAASATLHTSAPGTGGSCTDGAKVRVFPPDSTVALDIATPYSACGTFHVTTLVTGDGGR